MYAISPIITKDSDRYLAAIVFVLIYVTVYPFAGYIGWMPKASLWQLAPPYLMYFLLGRYIYDRRQKISWAFGAAVLVVGIAWTAFGQHSIIVSAQKAADEPYFSYFSLTVALAAAGLFTICATLKINNIAAISAISSMSGACYTVFLSHVFVLKRLTFVGPYVDNLWASIPLTAFACFAIGICIHIVLRIGFRGIRSLRKIRLADL